MDGRIGLFAGSVGLSLLLLLLGACGPGGNGGNGGEEEGGPVVRKTIDSEGGEVTSDDGAVTLQFLPGSLEESTEITIQRQPRPDRDDLYSEVYEFGPDDVQFDTFVPLEIAVPDASDDEAVVIGRLEDGEPTYLPGGNPETTDEGNVSTRLKSFSSYGAFGLGTPGKIQDVCERTCDFEHACGEISRLKDEVDYDTCVDKCVARFQGSESPSSECLEASDAWSACVAPLGCEKVGFEETDECADEWKQVGSACSQFVPYEIPEDPGFVADPRAEGPGGDVTLGAVVEYDPGDFSAETVDVELQEMVFHKKNGDEVVVEIGIPVDFADFEPETKVTPLWDVAIPNGTYTDVEFRMNPVEVVLDGNDETSNFASTTGKIPLGFDNPDGVETDQPGILVTTKFVLEEDGGEIAFRDPTAAGTLQAPVSSVLAPMQYENEDD